MSGCVSITDYIVGLDRQRDKSVGLERDTSNPVWLAAIRGVLEYVARSELDQELGRARMPVPLSPLLPAAKAKRTTTPKAPPENVDGTPVDFRPHVRPTHVVRFDSGDAVFDMTVDVIRDYVRTAEPVGVETGGFLWGLEPPNGTTTTVTRCSGPAADSKHKESEVILGDPCDVKEGGVSLRADLIPLGDFHSHPKTSSGRPSPDDRQAWVRRLQRSRLPSYVGVIAYRPQIGSWSLRAWHTYLERATGRYVVEPATIERAG